MPRRRAPKKSSPDSAVAEEEEGHDNDNTDANPSSSPTATKKKRRGGEHHHNAGQAQAQLAFTTKEKAWRQLVAGFMELCVAGTDLPRALPPLSDAACAMLRVNPKCFRKLVVHPFNGEMFISRHDPKAMRPFMFTKSSPTAAMSQAALVPNAYSLTQTTTRHLPIACVVEPMFDSEPLCCISSYSSRHRNFLDFYRQTGRVCSDLRMELPVSNTPVTDLVCPPSRRTLFVQFDNYNAADAATSGGGTALCTIDVSSFEVQRLFLLPKTLRSNIVPINRHEFLCFLETETGPTNRKTGKTPTKCGLTLFSAATSVETDLSSSPGSTEVTLPPWCYRDACLALSVEDQHQNCFIAVNKRMFIYSLTTRSVLRKICIPDVMRSIVPLVHDAVLCIAAITERASIVLPFGGDYPETEFPYTFRLLNIAMPNLRLPSYHEHHKGFLKVNGIAAQQAKLGHRTSGLRVYTMDEDWFKVLTR